MEREHLDHYGRLHVRRDASTAEIHDAYRARARVAHPDQSDQADNDTSEMAALNEAWFVLRDPARRAAYDDTLTPEIATPAPVAPGSLTDAGLGEDIGVTSATFRNFRRLIICAVVLVSISAVVLGVIGFFGSP